MLSSRRTYDGQIAFDDPVGVSDACHDVIHADVHTMVPATPAFIDDAEVNVALGGDTGSDCLVLPAGDIVHHRIFRYCHFVANGTDSLDAKVEPEGYDSSQVRVCCHSRVREGAPLVFLVNPREASPRVPVGNGVDRLGGVESSTRRASLPDGLQTPPVEHSTKEVPHRMGGVRVDRNDVDVRVQEDPYAVLEAFLTALSEEVPPLFEVDVFAEV